MKKIVIEQVERLSMSFKKAPYPTILSLLVLLVMSMGGYLITTIRNANEEKDEEIVYLKQENAQLKNDIVIIRASIDSFKTRILEKQESEILALRMLNKKVENLKK